MSDITNRVKGVTYVKIRVTVITAGLAVAVFGAVGTAHADPAPPPNASADMTVNSAGDLLSHSIGDQHWDFHDLRQCDDIGPGCAGPGGVVCDGHRPCSGRWGTTVDTQHRGARQR